MRKLRLFEGFIDFTCLLITLVNILPRIGARCCLLSWEKHEISVNICPAGESAESQLVFEWTDSALRRPDVSWHDSAQESLVMYLCFSYSWKFCGWCIKDRFLLFHSIKRVLIINNWGFWHCQLLSGGRPARCHRNLFTLVDWTRGFFLIKQI